MSEPDFINKHRTPILYVNIVVIKQALKMN